MNKRRDPPPSNLEDDGADRLVEIGKKLLSNQKISKDSLLKLLKEAAKILEETSQESEHLKLASGGICKALGKNDLLKHKDKEVRLFTAVCMTYTLRLHAPECIYNDSQSEIFFRLLFTVFQELSDPSAPHFRVCLGLIEIVAQIKICLLMLDLDGADSLVLDLFNTLFESINDENQSLIEPSSLEILSSIIDDCDDIPQPLLDCILGHLLPSAPNSSSATHHLTQNLLRRSQKVIQPYVQKFLTRLLEGKRTDSELANNCSDLIIQVHQTAPQIMLPVMPHLQPSLQVETEERRLDTVDLICTLLTMPGGHSLLSDYPALQDAVLGRLNDKSAEVRQRVLSHAKGLVDAFQEEAHCRKVVEVVAHRLQDPDEKIRSAAAIALCEIAADHPHVPRTAEYHALVSRLRDKRLAVRKQVATQVAKLIKTWTLQWEQGKEGVVKKGLVLELAAGLCTLSLTRDTDLAAHILDDLFKGGVFPSKLPPASAADWWVSTWKAAGEQGRTALCTLLRGKCDLQRQVQELLRLRSIVKKNSDGSGEKEEDDEDTDDEDEADDENDNTNMKTTGRNKQSSKKKHGNPEEVIDADTAAQHLEFHLSRLSGMLRDINKADEGLHRLFAMKDNHIFRELSTLASFGTSFKDAALAAKEVQSRVGSRGPTADVIHVLSARMMPNIISPEVLGAALEMAGENKDADTLLTDVAAAAPQLFAQSMHAVAGMFSLDDPMAAEMGARILAASGAYMSESSARISNGKERKKSESAHGGILSSEIQDKLKDMCVNGTPTGAKAAVKALVYCCSLQGNPRRGDAKGAAAAAVLGPLCKDLLASLYRPSTLKIHNRVLTVLKAISMSCRLVPEIMEEYAEPLYECVMSHIINEDLSKGKPLAYATTSETTVPVWEKPSPDIAIKSATLKALAQAFVPENPETQPSELITKLVSAFALQLGELTDIDTAAATFENFHWKLADVPWRRRTPSSPPADVDVDDTADAEQQELWDTMTKEEQQSTIKATQDASPDAGWLRLAAATALFRLHRAYDATLTGNEYITLGLACQDAVAEARQELLKKISATMAHFQTLRPNPQRAAKFAALYALYGSDPSLSNARAAQSHLRDYAASRRSAVERSALAAAAAGESGTLVNELPEFILPFLIFFMSHHPDYDSNAIFEEEMNMHGGGDHAGMEMDAMDHQQESPAAFLILFQNALQLALEVLLLPRNAALGSEEGAAEAARHAGATFKILRQLKFCDVIEVEESRNIDPEATISAHQLCDIALSLSRQLVQAAMGSKRMSLQKFPGSITLPKLCFRPRRNLDSSSKRGDYSDLPSSFRPVLHRPLFVSAFGFAVATPPNIHKTARRRTNANANGVADGIGAGVNQRGGRKKKSAAATLGDGAASRKRRATATGPPHRASGVAKITTKKKGGDAFTNVLPSFDDDNDDDDNDLIRTEMPVRHQPRRGAKDVAGKKLKLTTPLGEDFEDSLSIDEDEMRNDDDDGIVSDPYDKVMVERRAIDEEHTKADDDVNMRALAGNNNNNNKNGKSGLITSYLRRSILARNSGPGGKKGAAADVEEDAGMMYSESDDDAGFVVSPIDQR